MSKSSSEFDNIIISHLNKQKTKNKKFAIKYGTKRDRRKLIRRILKDTVNIGVFIVLSIQRQTLY